MKHGIFVNAPKANCSIYESGMMIYNAIKDSNDYSLSYMDVDRETSLRKDVTPYKKLSADFFIFNWHHWVLPTDKNIIRSLPGKKITIVLEVGVRDVLELTPRNIFDAYIVIDPTKPRIGNQYPFSRPLELADKLLPVLDSNKFVIGSFGLLGPDKRFEQIVLEANRIDNCIVRFNFPPVTWLGETDVSQRLSDHADYLRSLATGSTDVRITHKYMEKQELITWCSEHHLNSFPYYRNQPGLSAVTDQAISAGRGIAITSCSTFRHMHPYISHYPLQSYVELATSTLPGVNKMKQDWHPDNFKHKFNQLLTDIKIL